MVPANSPELVAGFVRCSGILSPESSCGKSPACLKDDSEPHGAWFFCSVSSQSPC